MTGRVAVTGGEVRQGRLSEPGLRASEPVRTCVGCRATGSRQALLRVVAPAGSTGVAVLVVDVARRMQGRGAWLHPDPHCLELAVKRRAFGRALRLAVPVDASAIAEHLSSVDQNADGSVPPAADRR